MSIDSKELVEAMERFLKNQEAHKKRLNAILEQWDKEDEEKLKRFVKQ